MITLRARQDAYALRLDASDIRDCVLRLSAGDFYKSMKSEKFPDLYQDVYHTTYADFELYLKLQMREYGYVVVVSLKLR